MVEPQRCDSKCQVLPSSRNLDVRTLQKCNHLLGWYGQTNFISLCVYLDGHAHRWSSEDCRKASVPQRLDRFHMRHQGEIPLWRLQVVE